MTSRKTGGIMATLIEELNKQENLDGKFEALHSEMKIYDEQGREHNLDGKYTKGDNK